MKPTVPLFLLPISTLALSLPPLIERQSRDSTPCAPLHIIALRGLNANNADPDWYQFLHQSVFQILASVPGSTSLGLQYDAGNTNQIEAINNGTVMLQEYVQSYVARCPEGKLGLLGYSDGATATSNAICGTGSLPYIPVPPLDSSLNQNVVATVVWGDLTRAPFQTWGNGTCPSYQPSITPRIDNHGCDAFADGYINYCDQGDTFCCGSLDTSNDAHHTYQNFYTSSTAQWVVERYQQSIGAST